MVTALAELAVVAAVAAPTAAALRLVALTVERDRYRREVRHVSQPALPDDVLARLAREPDSAGPVTVTVPAGEVVARRDELLGHTPRPRGAPDTDGPEADQAGAGAPSAARGQATTRIDPIHAPGPPPPLEDAAAAVVRARARYEAAREAYLQRTGGHAEVIAAEAALVHALGERLRALTAEEWTP